MKLDFDNIGAIKINGTLFGPVTFNKTAGDPGENLCGIYALAGDHAIGPIDSAPAGKPVLDIGGKVWLNVKCYDPANGTFHDGGYLAKKTLNYTFTATDGSTRTHSVSVDLLGLTPENYSGGVRVDGLSLPSTWTEPPYGGNEGTRKNQISGNADAIFSVGGTVRLLYATVLDHFGMPSAPWHVTANIPTTFKNTIRYRGVG